MGSEKFKRVVDDFEAAWDSVMARADVRAMVMGPSLRGHINQQAKVARALRKAIVKRCDDLGVAVVPEHRRLVGASQKFLKQAHNLCLHELRLAEQCDLIIILPATAGPLVELGMFAERPGLRAKSVLIVFDRMYRQRQSFINDGPRKAYDRLKARILDVDYGDVDTVLAEVDTLVAYEQATKASGAALRE